MSNNAKHTPYTWQSCPYCEATFKVERDGYIPRHYWRGKACPGCTCGELHCLDCVDGNDGQCAGVCCGRALAPAVVGDQDDSVGSVIAMADRESTNRYRPVERDANMRLIAAAPELLAALEGIMAAPMSTKAMLAAHAAIAKAKGKAK